MTSEENTLRSAFPSHLSGDVEELLARVSFHAKHSAHEGFSVQVEGETLHIPSRIYVEPGVLEAAEGLSPRQQLILRCYFTRHHNGWVREACLKSIIDSAEPWVVPFVIQLLGEYVREILDVIVSGLDALDAETYRSFLSANRSFYELTRARVVSYWNCYYRCGPQGRQSYPGFKALSFFDALLGAQAGRAAR